MSFPFPPLWNDHDKKHNHKDLKDFVLKVTDIDKKNESKRKSTKNATHLEHDHLMESFMKEKSDDLKKLEDDLQKLISKNENNICSRSLTPSFVAFGKQLKYDKNEDNVDDTNNLEEILNEIHENEKA